MSPNLKAFLDTIAWSELGPYLLSETDNGYNVCVGSTKEKPILFTDYSQHPKVRCEKLNSDAAGRYQFMGRYWLTYKAQLRLPDFGHDSQDRWAIQLIRECHAIDDIENGNFDQAIAKCASRWASLPSAGYGQHENSLEALRTAFRQAGGFISGE